MPITAQGERIALTTRTRTTVVEVPPVIETPQRVPVKQLLRPAESLRPSIRTIERAVAGNARARAIIDAWKWRPLVNVVTMTTEELERANG
jgi:hypothetical protein